MELIAITGGIALLAIVSIIFLARKADRPQRVTCENNVKQLLGAFAAYGQDAGSFPWAARRDAATNADWIHWQGDRFLTNSAIAPYATNFSARILQCPAGGGLRYREYPFSYSMNAHLEKLVPGTLENKSALILLYEEANPNDGACASGEPSDPLTKRHVDKSMAGFVDGHVELVIETLATMPKRWQPIVKETK